MEEFGLFEVLLIAPLVVGAVVVVGILIHELLRDRSNDYPDRGLF